MTLESTLLAAAHAEESGPEDGGSPVSERGLGGAPAALRRGHRDLGRLLNPLLASPSGSRTAGLHGHARTPHTKLTNPTAV